MLMLIGCSEQRKRPIATMLFCKDDMDHLAQYHILEYHSPGERYLVGLELDDPGEDQKRWSSVIQRAMAIRPNPLQVIGIPPDVMLRAIKIYGAMAEPDNIQQMDETMLASWETPALPLDMSILIIPVQTQQALQDWAAKLADRVGAGKIAHARHDQKYSGRLGLADMGMKPGETIEEWKVRARALRKEINDTAMKGGQNERVD